MSDEQFAAIQKRFDKMDERFNGVESRLDRLEGKVDAAHRDLLSLRDELRGLIDPDFPTLAIRQSTEGFAGAFGGKRR